MIKHPEPPELEIPTGKPKPATTKRFRSTDHKMFSRLIQCRTGHAHIGEYYRNFVSSEEIDCSCGAPLRTREHILKECRFHRLLLGCGRHAQPGRLTGTVRGIRKLATFIRRTGACEKAYLDKRNEEREKEWRIREGMDYFLQKDRKSVV